MPPMQSLDDCQPIRPKGLEFASIEADEFTFLAYAPSGAVVLQSCDKQLAATKAFESMV